MSAIEDRSFPFEHLSDICELESWRKEVNRPLNHMHKWWARRLGTAFRGILIGAFSPVGVDVMDAFYRQTSFPNAVVFDPFMGSGTTIGEALKLGQRAIGRDINPVSHFLVRTAQSATSRESVLAEFDRIESDVADQIRGYYQTRLADGRAAEVLYYFWVKMIQCPSCAHSVDLFSTYIFSGHAYPSRNPESQAACPSCGAINSIRYDAKSATCPECSHTYNPQGGHVHGQNATCPHCLHTFSILKAVKLSSAPPEHRMYAKMALVDGEKRYLPATDFDRSLYAEACRRLREGHHPYPVVELEPGYNTSQALGYNYTHWHQFFNERQLLSISILAERVRSIRDESLRDLFALLLSGTLEFNNMFASFKGEGTGAVRHMFSHHILKPERTPLEANLWGTERSSGSFSTLFKSRILRAFEYARDPFELRVEDGGRRGQKVFGLSRPLCTAQPADSFAEFDLTERSLYLSCGNSAETDLPTASVDAVVTDPPFFDNVHYSELADFFHVWIQFIRNGRVAVQTTRTPAEVQTGDSQEFARRLGSVWTECGRVLKPSGRLVFTYHHSRPEGWESLMDSLLQAGFEVVAAHPIKSEMSVSVPIMASSVPITLDVVMVCRKRSESGHETLESPSELLSASIQAGYDQLRRFDCVGRKYSVADALVTITAQAVQRLSALPAEEPLPLLRSWRSDLEKAAADFCSVSAT